MNLCDRCDRHYLAHEAACPFCSAANSPAGRPFFAGLPRMGAAVMAVLTPAVLAACYGAPPDDSGDTGGPKDSDSDGYTSDVDCDDENAAVNPEASEATAEECGDGLDNDCDGFADAEDPSCT